MDQRNMKIIDWSELESLAVGKFKPEPYYDDEADCFTLFISEEESRRERVDRYLTVYRSIETGRVTGCHIKDVSKVLGAAEAFQIDINAGEISLGLLLMAVPWTELEDREEGIKMHTRTYHEVVHAVGGARVVFPRTHNSNAHGGTCTC